MENLHELEADVFMFIGMPPPFPARSIAACMSGMRALFKKNFNSPLFMNIAIDIGHAERTGARGHGLEEHAVAANLARLLKDELAAAGHTVEIFDFPDCSNKEDLKRTAAAVNKGNWDCGVSLHCDASDSPSARGAHVCYRTAAGRRLAEAVAGPLCACLPGRAERVVRRADLYMLKATRPVWILCECGFLSNAHDAALLRDSPGRIAGAIAAGMEARVS